MCSAGQRCCVCKFSRRRPGSGKVKSHGAVLMSIQTEDDETEVTAVEMREA